MWRNWNLHITDGAKKHTNAVENNSTAQKTSKIQQLNSQIDTPPQKKVQSLHTCIHSSNIQKSQRWRLRVVHVMNYYSAFKKNQNSDTYYHTQEHWKHSANEISQSQKDKFWRDSTIRRYRTNSSRWKVERWGCQQLGTGAGGVGAHGGAEEAERALAMHGGCGCKATWLYLITLDCKNS